MSLYLSAVLLAFVVFLWFTLKPTDHVYSGFQKFIRVQFIAMAGLSLALSIDSLTGALGILQFFYSMLGINIIDGIGAIIASILIWTVFSWFIIRRMRPANLNKAS